jgi:hypothetical protein
VLLVGLYNAFARLPHRVRRLVARATGFRVVPGDPVLRDRAAEPERLRAWMRDQYLHPLEHRHTVREVQGWFRAHGIRYLRTLPAATLGDEPAGLFTEAEDDWWLERGLAQLGWMRTLAHEGGLFVAVGCRT